MAYLERFEPYTASLETGLRGMAARSPLFSNVRVWPEAPHCRGI
jgi:hypothetical protein